MIIALSAGRKNSKGFPGKNLYKLGSYPIMAYPIMAANKCSLVDKVYFSSDCKEQMLAAILYGADETFKRPDHLASDSALLEDVYVWLFNKVRSNIPIEFVVLLMSNAPCITSKMMEEMILILRDNKNADSICTVSKYNMYHPCRSRKLVKDWENAKRISDGGPPHGAGGQLMQVNIQKLVSYVPEVFDNKTSCDRDCNEDNWIYDCSAAIIRSDCLDYINEGTPPQKWLGKNILGYCQKVPAIDIDYEWQIGQIEYCLKKIEEN